MHQHIYDAMQRKKSFQIQHPTQWFLNTDLILIMNKLSAVFLTALFSVSAYHASAQRLSLDNAIRIAQENSLRAQVAQFSFMASYWNYRSFKAELKPAINLNGKLVNFDHSLVATRNFEDGRINYVNNNSLDNYLTLSIDQRLVATGGTVSLQSYLYRLDQFTYDETTWRTQPLRISYQQPLRAYNSLRWEKKTAPIDYQIAQRNYLSAMQDIAIQTTLLFFNVLSAQSSYRQSQATQADRDSLLVTAKRRLALGTMTKSEVLQLELSAINARMATVTQRMELDDEMYRLFAFLRLSDYEKAELVPPHFVPDITLSANDVLERAISNSTHTLDQKSRMLSAEQELARAKSYRGLQMTLNGELGLMQSDRTLHGAYSHLQDNEIVGLTLSLPIFDWGVSRGKVRMAKARMEMTRTQLEQEHQDYVQELHRSVMLFNIQPAQCHDALRAQEIANERYGITRRRFESGAVSVTDLNTAQQEMESAKANYIRHLQTFWSSYYSLQKSTLHDWINNIDLTADFEAIIK